MGVCVAHRVRHGKWQLLRISALFWITPALPARPILISRLLQQCFASLVQNKQIYFSSPTALSTRALLICTWGWESGNWEFGGRNTMGSWVAKGAGGEEGQGPLHSLLSSESITAPPARGTGLTPKKVIIHRKGKRRNCLNILGFFSVYPRIISVPLGSVLDGSLCKEMERTR